MTNTYRLEQETNDYADINWGLDKYDEYGVLHVYLDDHDSTRFERKAEELMDKYELSGIVVKFRKQKTRDFYEVIVGDIPEKEIIVVENDIKFIINLRGKIDVGLFLDHRPARELVASKAKDKSVLNLFSYTSSFSIYAALNGAKSTTSVDLSRTYTDWSKENFKINDIALKSEDQENFLWKKDALEFLQVAQKIGNKFDIVILDPPSFSRNKSEYFNIQEDHEDLIYLIYDDILTDDGFLLFSNNFKEFELSPSLEPMAEDITYETTPEEFKPYQPHHAFMFQK